MHVYRNYKYSLRPTKLSYNLYSMYVRVLAIEHKQVISVQQQKVQLFLCTHECAVTFPSSCHYNLPMYTTLVVPNKQSDEQQPQFTPVPATISKTTNFTIKNVRT